MKKQFDPLRPWPGAGCDPVDVEPARKTLDRDEVLREARKIARKEQWCDHTRVAECSPGCLCIKEARQKLRNKARAA